MFDLQANPLMRTSIPFLACGDLSGWDADKNYDLSSTLSSDDQHKSAERQYISLEPIQPPTAPAYKTAMELQKRQQQQPKQ